MRYFKPVPNPKEKGPLGDRYTDFYFIRDLCFLKWASVELETMLHDLEYFFVIPVLLEDRAIVRSTTTATPVLSKIQKNPDIKGSWCSY